jgi:hypothetical protein
MEWQGKDLYYLLTLSKQALMRQYPDFKWTTINRTRNKKLLAIKDHRLVDPRLDTTYQTLIISGDKTEVELLVEKNALLLRRLHTAQRQLDESKSSKVEYSSTLEGVLHEAMAGLELVMPIVRVIPDAVGGEHTVVVSLSDLQLGKITSTYNVEVCSRRMKLLADKIIRNVEALSLQYSIRELHIHLLGDILEGEDIFPGQAYTISGGIYTQIKAGWQILQQFIVDMLGTFEHIEIVGVIGNHGRIGSKSASIDPESNVDRILYSWLESLYHNQNYHEPRVTFQVPAGTGQRSWYAIDRIGDWGFLLCHGDQISGIDGIPFAGTQRKALGWIDAIEEPWDYLMLGHFHTPTMLTFGNRKAYFNGTVESSSEFAQEKLAATGRASQNMFLVSNSDGIVTQYEIMLEESKSNLARARDTVKFCS